MEYGIQRRGIYLRPTLEPDLRWLFDLFEIEEIWSMFGFHSGGRNEMLRAWRQGDLVTGILVTTEPHQRIGFVIMFPPDDTRNYWEFSYAIPEIEHRDAYAALNSTDAMAHYMFEHLNVDYMGWRVRSDNRAANAVVRRLGYRPLEEKRLDGKDYVFYLLDRPGWEKRRAKLDAGEAKYPSGLGGAFLTLAEPPYEPTGLPKELSAATEKERIRKAKTKKAAVKKKTKKAAAKKASARKAKTKKAAVKKKTKKASAKKASARKAKTKKAAVKKKTKKASAKKASARKAKPQKARTKKKP